MDINNIDIKINQINTFAPVISASLVNAYYSALIFNNGKKTNDEVWQDVITMFGDLTAKFSELPSPDDV